MKTTNRKLIGIAAIVAVAVCIAAALVIFPKGSSTKRGAAETDGFTEEAATVDRVLYADEMAAIEDAAVGDIVYFGSYEQDNDERVGEFGQKLAPGRCLTRRGEYVGAMLQAALHDLPVVEPRMARCVLHIFDDRKGLKIRKAGRT